MPNRASKSATRSRLWLLSFAALLPASAHGIELPNVGSGPAPGGVRAWDGGAHVKLERAAGVFLINTLRLGKDEKERAAAVQSGKRKRNVKGVDFIDPQDELKFGMVVRTSRQLAMLFLCHAVVEAIAICRRALSSNSPVVLTELAKCIDELWYAYFVLAASVSFEAIAFDEGSDHDNLMSAIEKLTLLWNKFKMPMLVKGLLGMLRPLLMPVAQPHLDVLGTKLRHLLAKTF